MKFTLKFVVGSLLLFVSLGLIVAALNSGWFGKERVLADAENSVLIGSVDAERHDKKKVKPKTLSEALKIPDSEVVNIGGIDRPKRDIGKKEVLSKLPKNPLPSAGKVPTLKGDENDQVTGLFQELKSRDGPREARSAAFLPEDFDKERYFEDPKTYLEKIRPGRVFKPAIPAEDVIPIAASSPRFTSLLQGESAILRVKASPSYPVTFYTPDSGEFSNRLKTISVAADENGIAETKFTAVSGTRGVIDILAASPLHSGQARFAVKVVLPNK